MDRNEIIERFCQLATEVGLHMGSQYATDCFCRYTPRGPSGFASGFQFEEPAIAFIEAAVREHISNAPQGERNHQHAH